MIPAIAAALDKIVGNVAALKNAKGSGRAYELMTMTAIAEELLNRSWNVWLQRSDGSRITPSDSDRTFYQRGGAPTGIMSGKAGSDNASSIVFSRPGSSREWEIWNGIKFEGRSGGTHEIDVAIVPRSVGQTLRAKPVETCPGGRPTISIECKDYGTPGEPDEMRAFLARLYDLTILRSHGGHIAHWPKPEQSIFPGAPAGGHLPFRSYWAANRETLGVLVRRTGFRQGALRLTRYYAVDAHGDVTSGSTQLTSFVDYVCDWILVNC